MKIKLTKNQVEWLKIMTCTETSQEALDRFIIIMKEEGCNTAEVVSYIEIIMLVKYPGAK